MVGLHPHKEATLAIDSPNFCTHCGNNLEPDAPVERDGWAVAPLMAHHLTYFLPRLTPSDRIMLHTLAAARGPVSVRVLAARMTREGSEESVRVRASLLAKKLRAAGVPSPIKSVWGYGYEWVNAA